MNDLPVNNTRIYETALEIAELACKNGPSETDLPKEIQSAIEQIFGNMDTFYAAFYGQLNEGQRTNFQKELLKQVAIEYQRQLRTQNLKQSVSLQNIIQTLSTVFAQAKTQGTSTTPPPMAKKDKPKRGR